MKLFGSLRELVAAVFRKDTYEVTVQPNDGTYTGAVGLKLPPVLTGNDVLVGQSAAQALSNKTLDSTNVVDSSRLDGAQVRKPGTTGGTPSLSFYEDYTNGTNKVSVQAPSALTTDYTFTLPSSSGSGQAAALVSTAGNGTTTWLRYDSGNTFSALVQRDGGGNFTAGTITANLTGNASGTASNVTGIVLGANGGTGVANTGKTITLGGSLTTSGAFDTTLTATATTNVTLPTSGTLATLAGSEALSNKTITASAISSDPSTAVGTGALKLPTGNATTDRPTGTAAQLKGMVRYNDTDDVFEGYNELSGWSSIGGGGTTDRVTQASHGFVVGDTLYLNGSTYTKAIATSAAAAEVVGVVSRVIDSSTFEITLSGEVSGLSGLTTGEVYFLSAATAGALTTTEPSVIGQVSVPVGVASSATTLYVAPKRGIVVGGSNARTEINLTNATTPQNIQDMSSYEAVEITGWVYIDATTDLRFYVAAQVSRGGSGVYNISYQTSGDTPPTGFSLTVTNPGQVQLTLSSGGVSGFASAKFNYALNAPAVGATFPLSVDSTQVNFNTIKAKDDTGLVFQEDGGTTTGTVSDAGAWTLGPSGAAAFTTLPGSGNLPNGVLQLSANACVVAPGGVDARSSATRTGGAIIVSSPASDASNVIQFYGNQATDGVNTDASLIGSVSALGGWMLGESGTSPSHTINGNVTVNGALAAASGQVAIVSGTPSGTIYTGADNVLVLVVASFHSGSQAGSHNMSIVNFRNVSGTPTLYIHTVASNFITVTQVAGTYGIQLQTTNGSTTTTNWSVIRLR